MPARPASAAQARRLACLYAHPAQRPLMESLLALESEIGASARPGLDHGVAHARLAYWREECARAALGRAAHPLLRAVLDCSPDPASLAGLPGLVTNVEWDLACATFETRAQLDAWLERWAHGLIGPLLAAAGAGSAALGGAGALREAELLAALAAELRAGHLRLPLDELAGAGLDPSALRSPPWPEALVSLLRNRHQRLRAHLAVFAEDLPAAARPLLRGLLVWSRLARAASVRAEHALPAEPHPGAWEGFKDALRAWRTALAAGG